MRPAVDDDTFRQLADRVGDAALIADVEAAYAELARDLAAHAPRCDLSGRCCRFREFDHELWVTGPEIIHFLASSKHPEMIKPLAADGLKALPLAETPADTCPLQLGRLCSVHAIRPMGCRMFFCQAEARIWGPEMHEESLKRLRFIGQTHSVPYVYVEWTAALSAMVRLGFLVLPQ